MVVIETVLEARGSGSLQSCKSGRLSEYKCMFVCLSRAQPPAKETKKKKR